MTLSIVIPCYNEEKLIARNFEHILRQTVMPKEVIFVDNNSTDNSLRIAQGFADKFKRRGVDLVVLQEKRQSQVFARILGFKSASSDLIGTLDVDSLICPRWVEIAKNVFSKDKRLIVISGPFNFYNAFVLKNVYFWFVFCSYKFIKPFYTMWGCNGVFKKADYMSFGGLEGCAQMVKDLDLNYASDDIFLTEMFRLKGRSKFVWKLRAKGMERLAPGRDKEQIINLFKIKRYIKKKYG